MAAEAKLEVFAALILRPRVNRIANVALAVVYALTIVAGAIGEWSYYILGSAVEVALLGGVVYHAWTWPAVRPGPICPVRPDVQY
jgi:hypothetical protein